MRDSHRSPDLDLSSEPSVASAQEHAGRFTRRVFLVASSASAALVAACDGITIDIPFPDVRRDEPEPDPADGIIFDDISDFPTLVPGARYSGGQIVYSDGNIFHDDDDDGPTHVWEGTMGAQKLELTRGQDLASSRAVLRTDIDGGIALDVRGLSEGRYDDIVRAQLGDLVLSDVRFELAELL